MGIFVIIAIAITIVIAPVPVSFYVSAFQLTQFDVLVMHNLYGSIL